MQRATNESKEHTVDYTEDYLESAQGIVINEARAIAEIARHHLGDMRDELLSAARIVGTDTYDAGLLLEEMGY